MSFTAAELDRYIENIGKETMYDSEYNLVPNPNYDPEWEGENSWMFVYYEKPDNIVTPWGPLEVVDTWGGEGDGAQIFVVVKVGDRHFEKVGYYSSWGESEMDGLLVEVEPFEKTVVRYRKVAS